MDYLFPDSQYIIHMHVNWSNCMYELGQLYVRAGTSCKYGLEDVIGVC